MARPHRRRTAAPALAALAAAALATPLLAGCGAVQKAMDCAKTATAVVNGVDKLQKAADNALDDPREANKALDEIDTNLKKVGNSAHDPDLAKAIDKMNTGIKNARTSINANKAPDLAPIGEAAHQMTAICTPGHTG
ncbi:hypothetical protein [Streptomyces sp. CT34]|uniref:hypothetical protein n=1 Tax=Streptomyces sp. CT34 TaxID=1553907 RepID=UPI0005BB2212|nr:hypothetical protein [Streptomyces sp. CT34]